MKFILFAFIFTFNFAYAATPIAEVIKIRGDVTQLAPTAKAAIKVALGDKLLEDTSILTSAKSFVKIKFIDNSELNVGPESKIVITEMKKNSPGIISLLKGRIRTEVEKDAQKNENKFFIKTRSAAMGVRGTDFQTIYNPDSQTTSLLTFKGEVAMTKVTEDVGVSPKDEIIDLKNKLATKETVLVPPGQSSFTSDAISKSSLPVKISPVQLNALYKNQEFYAKNEAPVPSKKFEELKVAEQKAPAEGLINNITGDFAPKAGGFIDQETGIYVAPDTHAVLDKKTGVYVSKKIGNIDQRTGEYSPPAGLILDAKKGFVIDDKHSSPTIALNALKNDLNKTVMTESAQGAGAIAENTPEIKKSKITIEKIPYKLSEKFNKDQFSIAFKTQTQKISLNEKEHNLPYVQMTYKEFKTISLNAESSSANQYRALFSLDYSQNKSGREPGSLFALHGGVKYALSKTFDIFSTVGLFQEQFLIQTNSTYPMTYFLNRIVLTRLSLGFAGQFYQDQKYSLDINGQVLATLRKRLNGTVIQSGGGLSFALMPKMKIGESKWLSAGLSVTNQNQSIQNAFATNKQAKNSAGIELKYIFEK